MLQLKSFFTGVKIQGATILHYAVRCGSTKAIDFILQKHKGIEGTSQVDGRGNLTGRW